jgi:glutamate racemase|tara:strand:- start:432 stop:905 length:474 start_codon:yes stop_codon:yes gene_type:complete
LLYLADHAHFPYGTRPLADVRKFATQFTRRLRAEGVKLITVTCNAASTAALHQLREAFPDTPFVGMEPAVHSTGTGAVGVLATEATFQGELFSSLLERFARNAAVLTQACPGIVELVEMIVARDDYMNRTERCCAMCSRCWNAAWTRSCSAARTTRF